MFLQAAPEGNMFEQSPRPAAMYTRMEASQYAAAWEGGWGEIQIEYLGQSPISKSKGPPSQSPWVRNPSRQDVAVQACPSMPTFVQDDPEVSSDVQSPRPDALCRIADASHGASGCEDQRRVA